MEIDKIARGWLALFRLSFRRMFWSTNTLMVLLPLILAAAFPLRRRFLPADDLAFERLTTFLSGIYLSLIVPICSLAYGTAGIGGDREDQSLQFLLVLPLPRPLMLWAKYAAALPLALAATMGGLWAYCQLAGEPGQAAWRLYWPACALVTAAYVGLFQLFATMFRHAAIAAVAYALFVETLLGNMPGMMQRLAVGSYARAWMLAAAEAAERPVTAPSFYEPLSAESAARVLAGVAVASVAAAAVVFTRGEYRDSGP